MIIEFFNRIGQNQPVASLVQFGLNARSYLSSLKPRWNVLNISVTVDSLVHLPKDDARSLAHFEAVVAGKDTFRIV